MVKAFSELTKKQKLYFVLLLVLGYLSPALGVVTFFFAKNRTEKTLLRYASLVGAALALVVYTGDYMHLLWT